MDFHTSEQWTFDIVHCYFRLPDPIAKVNAVRHCGWEKIKIATELHNWCTSLTKYFISFSVVLPLITYVCRVRKYPARSVPSQNKSFNLLCLLQHYMSKNGISETAQPCMRTENTDQLR